MTFEDLLCEAPCLRRLRTIDSATVRTLLDRRRKECTYCGAVVAKRRSTWCSDRCVDAFRERTDRNWQQREVLQRDKGICQICGRDVAKSERIFKSIKKASRRQWFEVPPDLTDIAEMLGYRRGHWSEVDHITPVCEGGGLCTLENLRLVCGACHLDVTMQLMERRRIEK